MRPGPGRAPVVVGIDAAGSSDGAVDWAAAEAAARGCPLRVVHAEHAAPPADPYGLLPPVEDLRIVRAGAEAVLRQAVARARAVASDVEVSASSRPAPPALALLDEARGACLLVLGSRARCGLRGLLTRSVAVQVSAHAPCPVVVVGVARRAGDPARSPARVVVGIDATGSCGSAVGFAFRAARRRGIPLVAVHAWTPDPMADLEAVAAPAAMAEGLGLRALERALGRRRSEFTDVPVHAALVRGAPGQALIAQSRGAALLVVGTRGRGQVLGTVLGSVSQTVLRHGDCPLAIIRHDGAPPARPPAAGRREWWSGHDRSAGHRSAARNRRRSA